MIGISGSGPSPTVRKSTEARTVQEDFQVRVTPDGSNRMRRWPKKSAGSIRGRRLEGYSSIVLVWDTGRELGVEDWEPCEGWWAWEASLARGRLGESYSGTWP